LVQGVPVGGKVSVIVKVGVTVAVLVMVAVGVWVAVTVGVLEGVEVGVTVGEFVGVAVSVTVGVEVIVAVGEFVAVDVGVEVKVDVQGVWLEFLQGVLVIVNVAVGVGGLEELEGDEGLLFAGQPEVTTIIPAKTTKVNPWRFIRSSSFGTSRKVIFCLSFNNDAQLYHLLKIWTFFFGQ